jgi:thiosulfate/3-mercaptopyruvate sulfurtransferase
MKIQRKINPTVDINWLIAESGRPDLVIIDIRSAEDYSGGHIPGSISIPFPRWVTTRSGLELELPDKADLFNTLGQAGISPVCDIVVVNKADHPYPLADAARVADTLIYAGCLNVAILNGGVSQWCKEEKELSKHQTVTKPCLYQGNVNNEMFVSKSYVKKALGKSIILDTRDPDAYFGAKQEPSAARAGHIPGAKNLPTPWMWKSDGVLREKTELAEMAASQLGIDMAQEIIVYCGVGGYASGWWFILSQLLGYSNVKFYDGSAQEWTADAKLPLTLYRWE